MRDATSPSEPGDPHRLLFFADSRLNVQLPQNHEWVHEDQDAQRDEDEFGGCDRGSVRVCVWREFEVRDVLTRPRLYSVLDIMARTTSMTRRPTRKMLGRMRILERSCARATR
jgi:hypothetical protein